MRGGTDWSGHLELREFNARKFEVLGTRTDRRRFSWSCVSSVFGLVFLGAWGGSSTGDFSHLHAWGLSLERLVVAMLTDRR